MTHDRLYYFLPYWDDKPCMHLRASYPDLRRRMYNSNLIAKIVDKLVSNISTFTIAINYYVYNLLIPLVSLTLQEDGLIEVASLEALEMEPEVKLRVVLEELCTACQRYSTVTIGAGSLGFTKLDKNRLKHCLSIIVSSYYMYAPPFLLVIIMI